LRNHFPALVWSETPFKFPTLLDTFGFLNFPRLWRLYSRRLDTLPRFSLLKVGAYADCFAMTWTN